jgi:hypothetical protein
MSATRSLCRGAPVPPEERLDDRLGNCVGEPVEHEVNYYRNSATWQSATTPLREESLRPPLSSSVKPAPTVRVELTEPFDTAANKSWCLLFLPRNQGIFPAALPVPSVETRQVTRIPRLAESSSTQTPFLSKIQDYTRVWLGTAYEHVPGSGPLERLRVINNRSANQTIDAGMTDSSPA